jgi:N-acetylmuramoyl-L-alanine amidase
MMSPRKSRFNMIQKPIDWKPGWWQCESEWKRAHIRCRMVVLLLVTLLTMPSGAARAQRLSPLAAAPDWSGLDRFHETMSKEEFQRRLSVYAPNRAADGLFIVTDTGVSVATTLSPLVRRLIRFAPPGTSPTSPPRYWKPLPAGRTGGTPLEGVHLALDPGHLGGQWALLEERAFRPTRSSWIQEGDMTLVVANHLATRLRALGARVSFVRPDARPVTRRSVDDLRAAARQEMERDGVVDIRETYNGRLDPAKTLSVQWHAERFFYRVSEIRERAVRVNERFRPDAVLCLHFNAEDWGDPESPRLAAREHYHMLVNGCYSAGELRQDDVRFEMLFKLFTGTLPEEVRLNRAVGAALAKATGLPPFRYSGPEALLLDPAGGVWARNLLANRLYQCPVIFCEPHVMNHPNFVVRHAAGDFKGVLPVDGVPRKSLYREYADALAEGLVGAVVAPQPAP